MFDLLSIDSKDQIFQMKSPFDRLLFYKLTETAFNDFLEPIRPVIRYDILHTTDLKILNAFRVQNFAIVR